MSPHLESLPTQTRIFLAGHRGMVGSAIHRLLQQHGYSNILARSSKELDLRDQQAVRSFFKEQKIDCVILAAAHVGGIHANATYPAEFIYENLMIQSNVIHQAFCVGITRLLFLGSSCIYPKYAPQPMREEYLLSGILESTNEPYAVAKISGIKMCEAYNRQYGTDFRAIMPTNLYGPGDNFHLENSHVIPAIMRKYHLGKLVVRGDTDALEKDQIHFGPIPAEVAAAFGLSEDVFSEDPYVQLWGTGEARREFLFVEDMASAALFVLNLSAEAYEAGLHEPCDQDRAGENNLHLSRPSFYNVGTQKDCTIREVAEIIRKIVGFQGETRYNHNQPDGTPRKLLDVSRLSRLGWKPSCTLRQGLENTYKWYCEQQR